MGSLFPDLNLFPSAGEPPPSAAVPHFLLRPKLEPKIEPLDEPTNYTDNNNNTHHSFSLNSQNGTVSPRSIPQIPNPNSNSSNTTSNPQFDQFDPIQQIPISPIPNPNPQSDPIGQIPNSPNPNPNPQFDQFGPIQQIPSSPNPNPNSLFDQFGPVQQIPSSLNPNPSLNSQSDPIPQTSISPNTPLNPKTEQFDPIAQTPISQNPNPNSQPDPLPQISQIPQTPISTNPQHYRNSPELGLNEESPDPDSRALVVVQEADNQVAVPAFKFPPRSSELVRVTDLSTEDTNYYREFVRKTRMVFDSLRVLAEETRKKLGLGMSARGDLRAASEMKVRGLWLFRDKRIVGAIPGIYVGDLFFFRMELCVFGLHGHSQAGIDYLSGSKSSNGEPIATSIVVSGGYEDDDDHGDVLIYTGQGGQDKEIKHKQIVSQKLDRGNLGLERSMFYGIEVRVIRGVRYSGSLSGKVYVYDGLYKVIDSWFDVGKSGFGVFKYKLVRVEGQPEMGSAVMKLAANLKNSPLSVKPVGYVSLDMSMGKERVPVLFYNDVDKDYGPMHHEYIHTTVFPPYAYQGGKGGCQCVSGCTDDCLCAKKNGGESPYDSNGLLLRGKPLLFECGSNCHCPPFCRNRVTQNGVKYRLEVFRSKETHWGVRSLDLIQAGSFICEFAGVALTREQAQILSMNGDSMVYPSQFATRWTEWGDLSPIFTDYVAPSYPSVPPLDFALDVSKLRNVACYISHSLSPNVFVQFVLYDHNNLMFPHLMLFAMESIPPMRELSLDYGVPDESSTGKLRICN